MLYFLKSVYSDKTFYLMQKTEFIVGRKGDVVIENDTSISRSHAKIQIKVGKTSEIVVLKDLGSKFKTFHNGQEVKPDNEVHLKDNDKIKFGGLASSFTFHQKKFVTTATKLSTSKKEVLCKQLEVLGGQYVDNWNSDCTHLTLEQIILTGKVLLALTENKPIVLPGFWTKYTENVAKNLPPPDINDYNDPPVTEALFNKVELKRNLNRKDLFKNNTFLFYTEKEKRQVDQIIQAAGGTTISWENDTIKLEDILQSTREFLIIQPMKLVNDKNFNEIIEYFAKKSFRTIPSQEIAMAIIHGSCQKDCNPAYNRAKAVFQASDPSELTHHKALVDNTQSQVKEKDKFICPTVPETVDDGMDAPPIKKRKTMVTSTQVSEVIEILDDEMETTKTKTKTKPIEKEKQLEQRKPIQSPFISSQEKSQNSFMDVMKITNTIIVKDKEKAHTSKRKAESTSVNPFDVQLEQSEVVPRTGKTDTSKSGASKTNGGDKPNLFSFSLKRKADESTSNPFLSDKFKVARTEKESPFSAMKIHTSSDTISPDNTFMMLIKKKDAINKTDVSNVIKTEEKPKNEPWYYTKADRSIDDKPWVSKNSSDLATTVAEVSKKDLSDLQQQIIELFEDKFMVSIMSNFTLRSTSSTYKTDVSVTSSKVNFKKFVKVKPLHPQTTAINF